MTGGFSCLYRHEAEIPPSHHHYHRTGGAVRRSLYHSTACRPVGAAGLFSSLEFLVFRVEQTQNTDNTENTSIKKKGG